MQARCGFNGGKSQRPTGATRRGLQARSAANGPGATAVMPQPWQVPQMLVACSVVATSAMTFVGMETKADVEKLGNKVTEQGKELGNKLTEHGKVQLQLVLAVGELKGMIAPRIKILQSLQEDEPTDENKA